MTLSQKILDAARDEVARKQEWGKEDLEKTLIDTMNTCPDKLGARMYTIESKAALLAMEKQAEFFRWLSIEDYCFFRSINVWSKEGEFPDRHYTELELYGIWEGQK